MNSAILLDGAQGTGIVLIFFFSFFFFPVIWVIQPFILASGEIAIVEI